MSEPGRLAAAPPITGPCRPTSAVCPTFTGLAYRSTRRSTGGRAGVRLHDPALAGKYTDARLDTGLGLVERGHNELMAGFANPNMTAAIAGRWQLALADARAQRRPRRDPSMSSKVSTSLGSLAQPGPSAWDVAASAKRPATRADALSAPARSGSPCGKRPRRSCARLAVGAILARRIGRGGPPRAPLRTHAAGCRVTVPSRRRSHSARTDRSASTTGMVPSAQRSSTAAAGTPSTAATVGWRAVIVRLIAGAEPVTYRSPTRSSLPRTRASDRDGSGAP